MAREEEMYGHFLGGMVEREAMKKQGLKRSFEDEKKEDE